MKCALAVLAAALCGLAPCAAFAAEPAPKATTQAPAGAPARSPTPETPRETEISLETILTALLHSVLQWLAANPFTAALIFLVLAALVGMVLSRKAHDRCLSDFEGYPITLELKDGTVYHGELDVEKTGLEFIYEKTTPQEGLTKTSFLIYQPEYNAVHALIRYPDRLNEEQLKARERAARRAYHPNVFRRTRRALRNTVVGAKDSIYEAFGLAMGRAKGIQAAAPVMESGGKYIERVGKQTIGTAADVAYDPLLEKQIGLRVVLVLPQDTAVQNECVGTFREYTKDFFALMDVDYASAWDVLLAASGAAGFVRGIAAQRSPSGVHIENCNTFDVQLGGIALEAQASRAPSEEGPAEAPEPPVGVPVTLPSGKTLEFPLPPDVAGVTLSFTSTRKADLIVPRTGAFVRHKSEWVEPKELVGSLHEAIGLLPGTDQVVSLLKQGAELIAPGTTERAVPFVKMHGCGNDYIYIDCRHRVLDDPAALARRLSDRHFGIGADGLILVLPSQRADYRMRMFDPDGSEAEMCGNGLRGLVKYLYDRDLLDGEEARIETGAGVLTARVLPEASKAARVHVDMGAPRLERADIPMDGPPGRVIDEELTIEVPGQGGLTVRVTAASMGNPHCVTYVDDVDAYPVEVHGPLIENHPRFPRRTNAEFVQVLSRGEVRMRVWERGAGETLACGTGACAAAVAGVLNGKTDRSLLARLPGGDLEVEWPPGGSVALTGPATEVFEGVIHV